MANGRLSRIMVVLLLSSTSHPKVIEPKATECISCLAMQEEMAIIRTETIKAAILKKLGLTSPPKVQITPEMKPLLERIARHVEGEAQKDGGITDKYGTESTDAVVIFGRNLSQQTEGQQTVSFQIPSNLKTKEILSGTLTVKLRRPKAAGPKDREDILECVVNEMKTGDQAIQVARNISKLHGSFPDFAKVPLRLEVLQRWMAAEEPVTLTIAGKYHHEDVVNYPTASDPYTFLLEIITADQTTRYKRDVGQNLCHPNENIKSCCRYDLIIDFDASGWDFVVFPPTYNAFMCLGECNRESAKIGYHSVLTLLSKRASACCHPGEYEELEVTTLTPEGNLRATKIPKVIAKSCVCG